MRGKFLLVAMAVLLAASAGIGFVEVISAAPSKMPIPWGIADRLTVKGPTQLWGSFALGSPEADLVEYNTGAMTLPVSAPLYSVATDQTLTTDTTTAVADGQYPYQMVTYYNRGSQNLVIKNSANTDLGSGDVTLGGTDILTLLWNGTTWIKAYTADN
jgi:hypothetical protein